MSFKKELFKNILISGGYNYLSQGISFLSSTVISRLLLPENYGLVGLITVFTGFISIFSDGGISYALIRSNYGPTYQRVLANIALYLGITLCLITILLAYPISRFYQNNDLLLPTIVLAFTFIINSLSLTQGAILTKNLEFAFIGKVTVARTILTVILTIILAYFHFECWSLIYPQIMGGLLVIILYENKVKLGYRFYPLNYLKVTFKHTKKLMGSMLGFYTANYWARNADNVIVGKIYHADKLGIYNRAYSLLTLPLGLITGLFGIVLFPSLKKLKEKNGNIEDEYYFVLRVIELLGLPLVFIFILFPVQLVSFLWGKNWILVSGLLPYFGLLIYTQTLLSTIGQLLVLQNKEREFMISGWISALFLVSGIVFGAFISIIGIAQFYALSYILLALTFNVFYSYIYALKFDKKVVLFFWGPKILISFLIWAALYFDLSSVKFFLLITLVIYTFIDARKNLFSLNRFVKGRLFSYRYK